MVGAGVVEDAQLGVAPRAVVLAGEDDGVDALEVPVAGAGLLDERGELVACEACGGGLLAGRRRRVQRQRRGGGASLPSSASAARPATRPVSIDGARNVPSMAYLPLMPAKPVSSPTA